MNEGLEEERDVIQEKLDKHKKFHTYMDGVLELSDEFSEVREITSRYETLSSTYQVSEAINIVLQLYVIRYWGHVS